VESLQTHSGVFHDRGYNFDSLGHFAGKTFIKYSNDDKYTDHAHVMTKLRISEPLTVYIVKLEDHSLPWLQDQGYELSSYTGVSFSGIRQSTGVGAVAIDDEARDAYRQTGAHPVLDRETRHKEWEREGLNLDPTSDIFSASSVWSKTFAAGTISIPGNNGGDGSFLIFLDRPGACDAMTHMMIQGCNNNPRDIEPGCNLADVRCCSMEAPATSCNSGSFAQTITFLDGMVSEGTACAAGRCNGVADTWCHSAVTFEQAQEICASTGERLCTRAEIEDDAGCGSGCSDDSHLIWFSDELPRTPPGYDPPLEAYWEHGNCGVGGNDQNWEWCGQQSGNCPATVETSLCDSGLAELAEFNGNGNANSYTRDGCNYFWHAQYVCATHTGPEVQCNDRYEAEAAVRHGGVFDDQHAGFTGSGFVDYLNPTGDYIEWSLPSCSGGEATLHFRYALAGADRPMEVLLNGVQVAASLSFPPSNDWTVYRRTALTVTLRAGVNTVRLMTTGASGANLDSLLVLSGTPSYYIETYGIAECPSGQAVMTQDECYEAHNQLELECSTCNQQSNTDWVGDHGGIPNRCSTRETNWGGQHHFHWDRSGEGTAVARADLAPVCRV